MDVVIEMTGNGKLPTSASLPNSTQPTRMTSLEIYLVSQTLATNITVSQGPALLANQSGSVAHIPFTIPTCAVTGDYNVSPHTHTPSCSDGGLPNSLRFMSTRSSTALPSLALRPSLCTSERRVLVRHARRCSTRFWRFRRRRLRHSSSLGSIS
jgi:hypothetical protein